MLKVFRKKIVSRIILWGLLILILPAFVMWGSASMSRSKDKGPNYIGIIDNKKISFEEFYAGLTGVRTQVILNYFNQPKLLESIIGNKPLLAKLAWDRIILLYAAKKLNTKVSDKEVVDALQKHPLFIRNGAFDPTFYAYVLRNNIGLEPRAFEEIVRDNISIQKLSYYLAKDLKLSDEELLSEYKKDFEKVKIGYVLIEPKSFMDQVNIGEGAAKEFYDAHKNELIVKANINGTTPDRIATFEESKETIEKYLKEVEARKILKNKVEDIYKKLLERVKTKNETFTKAASGLGLTVKDTDFFSKMDTLENIGNIPIVIESASGLKDMELSKPVEIDKGLIIFEVVQRKNADEEAFKKDKEEYAKKVRERNINIIMEDWLKKAEGKASLAVKLEEVEKYYK